MRENRMGKDKVVGSNSNTRTRRIIGVACLVAGISLIGISVHGRRPPPVETGTPAKADPGMASYFEPATRGPVIVTPV